MGGFMREGRVIALGVNKALEGRHADVILRLRIAGHGPAMHDACAGRREEGIGAGIALDGVKLRRSALAWYCGGRPSICSTLKTV